FLRNCLELRQPLGSSTSTDRLNEAAPWVGRSSSGNPRWFGLRRRSRALVVAHPEKSVAFIRPTRWAACRPSLVPSDSKSRPRPQSVFVREGSPLHTPIQEHPPCRSRRQLGSSG